MIYFSVIKKYEDLDGRIGQRTVWVFPEEDSAHRLIGFLKENTRENVDLYVEKWSIGEATT